MKATEAKLLDFLKKSSQFVIPIYQRTYSWTEKECRQLWDDIIRCGLNDNIPVHFIGSIVYVESGLSQVTHQSPLLVIDGQQRLTTVSLLLCALSNLIEDSEPFDGFTKRKIRNYYLLNPEESDDRYYKMLLSQTDKKTLTAIVDGSDTPENFSLRIKENYDFFTSQIKSQITNLENLCKGLAKLVVVDIALNREQDNPQLIFESMNSTGKELSQADLIRNFILMGLEHKLQTRLYEQYWRPMEIEFGQESYGSHFDKFMRHFLTVVTGEIPKISTVYDAFKTYSRKNRSLDETDEQHTESLVKMVREYSKYYCAMALGREKDKALKSVFHDLSELKVDVSYPLLLELYHDYTSGILCKDDFLSASRLVESYVFRRAVCTIPTNSLNKTFATVLKVIKKDQYLESIEAYFLLLPSYRRFPHDEEFKRELKVRDLYHFRNRSYWLRRFENHDRKELVPVDEYTVEHILPQNENLNDAWKSSLGADWKRIQETWLHTLGNLTLTGYNSEYSDRSFIDKRDMDGGFKDSPLRVNKWLGTKNDWNEATIKERAINLSDYAVNVWKAPLLERSILDNYRKKDIIQSSYSIEDHPFLSTAKIQPIYEALKTEIFALDPCVTEEYLKLYVAFKAETNFVDIVPQASRLRLSLNMKFSEISDPREFCKDVSNLGRWGNGDVEVGISTLDDLPYVIGLIRQALEKQLGESDDS